MTTSVSRGIERNSDATPPLLTRPLLVAALVSAVLNLAGFLFVHLPGFLQQLGAGEAQVGRIMAAQAIGAILAWPIAGRAIDALGARVVTLAGVVLFVVVVALYLSIDALGPTIYLVRALDGVAGALWYTGLLVYASNLVPVQRRTEGLAIFGVAGLLSIGLGAQSGDVILAYATYREVLLVALGFAVFGASLCVSLRDVPPVGKHDVVLPRGLVATALQRDLVPVWFAAFTFFIAFAALFSFMKTFVVTTGTGSVGSFFVAYAAMASALRIFLGWLPDRLGARRTLGVAMTCYAAGLVALSLADTAPRLMAAGFLCGAGHGYIFPVLVSLVVTRARPQERGMAMAFFMMLDWLGLVLAGPAVGYAIERTGYAVAFMAVAMLVVTGMGGFYGLDRRHAPRRDYHPG